MNLFLPPPCLCLLLFFISGHVSTATSLRPSSPPTTTSGFTLQLIHIDNPSSPFYNSTLTHQQRYQNLHHISDTRMQHLHTSSFQVTPENAYPQTYAVHTVLVGVGTPPVENHLMLNTGSDVVWTQCWPSQRRSYQRDKMFIPKNSATYRRVPCSDDLLKMPNFSCVDKQGVYRSPHGDLVGFLSKDTISSPAVNVKNTTSIENFPFVCMHKNYRFLRPQATGSFGLGYGVLSSTSQISKRFSYCLSTNMTKPTYLRFGCEIRPHRNPMMKTPLLRFENSNNYFLNLKGISIGALRLDYNRGEFDQKQDGSGGGCIIDTEAVFTYLVRPVYERVIGEVSNYFKKLGLKEVPERLDYSLQEPHLEFQLCYYRTSRLVFWKSPMKNLPTMDLHFEMASLKIPAKNLFLFDAAGKTFCLALKSSEGVTIIGNYQQRDVRFVYDLENRVLEFAPEDCSEDIP